MSGFEEINGKKVRARQGQLTLRRATGREVVAPWIRGLGLKPAGKFNGWMFRISADDKQIEFSPPSQRGAWTPYLPVFSRALTLHLPNRLIPDVSIRIEATCNTRHERGASNLLKDIHYLNPTKRGLTVVAICDDDRIRHAVRHAYATRHTANGLAFAEMEKRYGAVVGGLRLDRLGHGSPLGRTELARDDGAKLDPNEAGDRGAVLRALGLYWISRVASDRAFKGAGIGAALCDAAREIALTRMAEPGRWTELMRKAPPSGTPDFVIDWQNRFGVASPFKKATIRSKRRDLAYYYAPVGPMIIK